MTGGDACKSIVGQLSVNTDVLKCLILSVFHACCIRFYLSNVTKPLNVDLYCECQLSVNLHLHQYLQQTEEKMSIFTQLYDYFFHGPQHETF